MCDFDRSHQVLVHVHLREPFDYTSDLTCHPKRSGGKLKLREVTPGSVAIDREYESYSEVAVQKNRRNTVCVS